MVPVAVAQAVGLVALLPEMTGMALTITVMDDRGLSQPVCGFAWLTK
jgi:hypothetical protein